MSLNTIKLFQILKALPTLHLSFPPEEGRGAGEAFQSVFSHTDGKIGDRYGEGGCGRKMVSTERY
jgi:hypothetical protein